MGRPIPPLILSSEERETVERWRRRHSTSQALALRARIVLGCAEGVTNTAIVRELRLTKQTVGKWRSRFLLRRLDGLYTGNTQDPGCCQAPESLLWRLAS
jgi:hypothetical protein